MAPSAPTRLEVAPCDVDAVLRLEAGLEVPRTLAQVLVRRGLADLDRARAFLEGDERHPPEAFGGLLEAAARVLGHVRAGSAITVHGDYDVDGVCSTAILVRVLRTLGADVDAFLPSRTEDGYGLALHTVERLAARGTDLLITADCAVTAVDEVARARALGMDVVVTDHHAPRADGVLPDAPIVHPRLGGYPCPDLCAAGVAHRLAGALLRAAGHPAELADADLDLVALATVADLVPLVGENRRLVAQGLRALARTEKPGLQALMRVGRVDPSAVDASAVGFRLAPRINAAGRLYRADAGLELVLTEDPERARAIAAELDAVNAERRDTEQRITWEAEAQARALVDARGGELPAAFVLAGEGWHPGVIGIVASRIVERFHRPAVVVALDGAGGATGSGRSISAFHLLDGLAAAGGHLRRYGGHRAAAGLTLEADRLDAFREAFCAHAAAALGPEQLARVQRVDAVVSGAALDLELAEALARLEPCGMGNPAPTLLVRGAACEDARGMGEGRHVAFTLRSGGARSRCVAFGQGSRAPADPEVPVDAVVRLEVNAYAGAVEPRLVLKAAAPSAPAPIALLGEPEGHVAAMLAALAAPAAPADLRAGAAGLRLVGDRRGEGGLGLVAELVASGESVLVLAADAAQRARVLGSRVGGFALAAHGAVRADPGLAAPYRHVVCLDPPAAPLVLAGRGHTHLAWGEAELGFATRTLHRDHALRDPLIALYRALRAAGGGEGAALEALLRGNDAPPRPAQLTGRLVRVLVELDLVAVDAAGPALTVSAAPERTELERSPTFRAAQRALQDGHAFLTSPTPNPDRISTAA